MRVRFQLALVDEYIKLKKAIAGWNLASSH